MTDAEFIDTQDTEFIDTQDTEFLMAFSIGASGDYLTVYDCIAINTPNSYSRFVLADDVVESSEVNLSSYDFTDAHQPVIYLGGNTWTLSSGLILGDYWNIAGNGGKIVGNVAFGANNNIDRTMFTK